MMAETAVSLDDLKVSETARIRALTGPRAIRRRLGEMGLTAGSSVRVVRVAPLGDPIQINVRDYHLCLRRAEGRCVLVERTTGAAPDDTGAFANSSDRKSSATERGAVATPKQGWIKRLGAGAFLLFAIKSLLWLLVPLLLFTLSWSVR